MFSNVSLFGEQQQSTPVNKNCDIVFISDLFLRDYVGGAELTSQALIESSPLTIQCLRAADVNLQLMEELSDKHWVFGNWSHLNINLLPAVISNLSYSVLEYDYKYCKYRSPQRHANIEGNPCDCHDSLHGKLVSAFYYGAKSLWWMSESQMDHYHTLFPFLSERPNQVLSSVFDDKFFLTIKALRKSSQESGAHERKGWLVLGSDSWVKGTDAALELCKTQGLEYEVIRNLPYSQVLEKMSLAEGLVYLPVGWDTCPRLVIEAKLLGCKLILNDNVQHRAEEWFSTDDILTTESYLYAARDTFWNGIRHFMDWVPTISGYTTTRNCLSTQYPWRQSISSMLGFCNEVVVVDGDSTDGTLEELRSWSEKETRLKVHSIGRDGSHPGFSHQDWVQMTQARKLCTGKFLWHMDIFEVLPEKHWTRVVETCRTFPKEVDVLSLPVVQLLDKDNKVKLCASPWKNRLSRNLPHITHGIPWSNQRNDTDSLLDASAAISSMPSTYVNSETGMAVPYGTFYSEEVNRAHSAAMQGDPGALSLYKDWFQRVTNALPSVTSYSSLNSHSDSQGAESEKTSITSDDEARAEVTLHFDWQE